MAEVKRKFGKMKCETCGEPVTVKANERDTLSYNCQECDAQPYAKKGTGQYAVWVAKCGNPVSPVPETPEPEKQEKPEKPQPKAKPAPEKSGLYL